MPDPQDIVGGNRAGEMTVEFPPLQTLEELDQHVESTYGRDVNETLRRSIDDQVDVAEDLHAHGLNGRAEALQQTYQLHRQEFDRRESLLGKAWNTTKEVVTAPFRWTWESFKKYPVMTTVGVTALALSGVGAYLYYAGQLEAALTAVGAGKIASFFTETAAELAPLTPDTPIVPGMGEAGLPGGLPAPEAPPTFGA